LSWVAQIDDVREGIARIANYCFAPNT
jgi:hypothetical protein